MQILQKIGAKTEECLMVGNDVGEDMIATEKLGMQVFLLTDDLINKTDRKVSDFPNGNFDDLIKFLGWTEQL
ncbi:MAG: HAD hydrolase-like protein [Clostridia bacterium]|nr:HAD hydrolase-like protein [Clostridia bacterium]MBQ4099739.1 HAD hydrolase-like protein [Clostridia bacterium]